MADALKSQVEKILDEGTGERRSVLVCMGRPSKQNDALLRTASIAVQMRNLSLTARDLLPAARREMRVSKSGERPQALRTRLRAREKGFAAQVAALSLPSVAPKALRTAGFKAVAPLLDLDVVKRAIAQTRESKAKTARSDVASFWTSKSVLLDMKRDDLAKLPSRLPQIRDIYPNRELKIPRLVEAKNLPTTILENKASSWGVHAIGALGVWGAYGARGKGVKIGVLDTGVDASHPDLTDKIAAWAEFDAEGREVQGSTPHDSDRHGTHVTGTIVGGNAGGQWIGVAPEAEVASALVLDGENGGTDAQVLAGIDWAVEQGVDVINMSLGGLTLGPEAPSLYTEAIITSLRAGIPVVCAIGNEGQETTGSPGNDYFAFSVGATDHRDLPAGFSGGRTQIIRESNFIPPEFLPLPYSKPEISAPGVAVRSSVPGGGYAAFNGTSMATPHAAGAIALLLSATSVSTAVPATERAFVIQDLMIGSVEELGEAGQDHRYGLGRIDVLRAIGFAKDLGY